MSTIEIEWDFFLAHAGPDADAAESLHSHLCSCSRVFLDTRCLVLGDDWDAALAKAQQRARISVVLVSTNTGNAYYQREEVAAAISLARESGNRHRVVPVYLNVDRAHEDIPYGLRLKHGITLGNGVTMAQAAARLLDLKRSLDGKRREASQAMPVGQPATSTDRTAHQTSPPHGSTQTEFEEGESLFLKRDFTTAYALILRAAEDDHRLAPVALGYMHWHGKGCEKSRAQAITWFKYAADRGDAKGMFYLSQTHLERNIDNRDPEELRQRARLLLQSAESGLAAAQVALGVAYLQGSGVPQDFGKAMKWYRMAAERGSASAMGNIAELYEKGLGVANDPVKAAQWNRKDKEQRLKDQASPVSLPWSLV